MEAKASVATEFVSHVMEGHPVQVEEDLPSQAPRMAHCGESVIQAARVCKPLARARSWSGAPGLHSSGLEVDGKQSTRCFGKTQSVPWVPFAFTLVLLSQHFGPQTWGLPTPGSPETPLGALLFNLPLTLVQTPQVKGSVLETAPHCGCQLQVVGPQATHNFCPARLQTGGSHDLLGFS